MRYREAKARWIRPPVQQAQTQQMQMRQAQRTRLYCGAPNASPLTYSIRRRYHGTDATGSSHVMSVSQSAEMTSPEDYGELIQMALTFGIFTRGIDVSPIIDFDHGGAGKLGTDFVSRVGDSQLDDHIAFAKVQQAGHQRHGLLGTHGGYGGAALMDLDPPRAVRGTMYR